MAPCPMLHESRAHLDPLWSAALHITAILVFIAFVYLARISRREQDELKELEQQQAGGNPGKQCKQTLPADEKRAYQTSVPLPPNFFLVGDSTTAVQAEDGGGWGSGFLSVLIHGAKGTNYGRNGATTRDYVNSGLWDEVLDRARAAADTSPVFVTIQFGHNDQIPSRGVSLVDFRQFLVRMARDVLAAGATPILLTPLARRDFDANGNVIDNLRDHRLATLQAFQELTTASGESSLPSHHHLRPRCLNLNAASLAFVDAIGHHTAQKYNLHGPDSGDTTHLNKHGSIIFGRMLADLLLGHPPVLVKSGHRDTWTPGDPDNEDSGLSAWIKPSPLMSSQIWHGHAA